MAARQHQTTLGRCILSDKDKMIQPDAFRAAPYDEEYIENQCYERQVENDHCSYELYANSTFLYAETKISGLNQKEVRKIISLSLTYTSIKSYKYIKLLIVPKFYIYIYLNFA